MLSVLSCTTAHYVGSLTQNRYVLKPTITTPVWQKKTTTQWGSSHSHNYDGLSYDAIDGMTVEEIRSAMKYVTNSLRSSF